MVGAVDWLLFVISNNNCRRWSIHPHVYKIMIITACYNSELKVEIVKELLPCYWELCGVDNVVPQLPQTKHECAMPVVLKE